MRPLLALGLAFSLGGCVDLPHLNLPTLKPAAAASQTAPEAPRPVCPADLLADLEDRPAIPPGAKLPAPETADMSSAFAQYLAWLRSFAQYGQDGWERAAEAKAYCEGKK